MDDMESLIDFRCQAFGGSRAVAAAWLQKMAGLENVLLVPGPPATPGEPPPNGPAAMLCTIPVSWAGRKGVLFCGMATQPAMRGKGVMSKLLSGCLRAYAAGDCSFAITAQVSAYNAEKLAGLGFQPAFPLRALEREIPRNLWAQADFDTLTVKRLLQARLRYQPGCVCLPEASMTEMVAQMYSRGATLVSSARGYGLYYLVQGRQGTNLQFAELQADNDHSADLLLQAAREKTGAAKAQLVLAENQALYLGAGRRCGYAMLRFLKEPFPVRDGYFRLLLGE